MLGKWEVPFPISVTIPETSKLMKKWVGKFSIYLAHLYNMPNF